MDEQEEGLGGQVAKHRGDGRVLWMVLAPQVQMSFA